MSVAILNYQEIRQAVFRLPQQQRLRLIKDAILTLSDDESVPTLNFDFDEALKDLQCAFAKVGPFADQERDDTRYAHLMERHGL